MVNAIQLTLLIALMVLSYNLSGQDKRKNLFSGIASIGMNACQIDGDGPYGYKYIGVTGGVGALARFHKNVSLSLEINYVMRGSIVRRNLQVNPQKTFAVSMDYIETPLCLNFTDGKIVLASVGLSPAVLTRFKTKYQEFNVSGSAITTDCPDCLARQPKRFDLSAVVGLQFLVKGIIGIGGRFSYSIIGIRPPCISDTRAKSQCHNVLTFKICYFIDNKSLEESQKAKNKIK